MVNSKQKGNRTERQARKIMKQITGCEWEKTVFSGSLSKTRNNQVYEGDIHCVEEKNMWKDIVVEVKSTKQSIKLQHLFSKNSKWNKEYIAQAQLQKQKSHHWLLIVKVNYEGWFIAENLPVKHKKDLVKAFQKVPIRIKYPAVTITQEEIKRHDKNPNTFKVEPYNIWRNRRLHKYKE